VTSVDIVMSVKNSKSEQYTFSCIGENRGQKVEPDVILDPRAFVEGECIPGWAARGCLSRVYSLPERLSVILVDGRNQWLCDTA
jgi:hypothetical protein